MIHSDIESNMLCVCHQRWKAGMFR
uniref:Uncharacterized protein n=1 Tax=Arundo donax TaxID=35708 RepID=A0A0A9EJ86_ARUDO